MTQEGQSDPPALETPPEAELSTAQEREPELGHEEPGAGAETGAPEAESPSLDAEDGGAVEDCGAEGKREDERDEVMDGGEMKQEEREEEEVEKEEERRCGDPETDTVDENTRQSDTRTDEPNGTERLVLSWQRQFRKCQNRIKYQIQSS